MGRRRQIGNRSWGEGGRQDIGYILQGWIGDRIAIREDVNLYDEY